MTTSILTAGYSSTSGVVLTPRSNAAASGTDTLQSFSNSLMTALAAVRSSVNEVDSTIAANTANFQDTATSDALKSVQSLLEQLAMAFVGHGFDSTTNATAPAATLTVPQTIPATSVAAADPFGIDAEAYFRANPDAAQAYLADSKGMNAQLFAQNHYDTIGKAKGVSAPATLKGMTGDSYFNSAAYLNRQTAYLSQAETTDSTGLWINAALNQAMELNKINGYEPDSGYTVNVLRGYYSGDAQARSNAIHAVQGQLLSASGGYETSDYGLHRIAGTPPASLDTTRPTFATEYDHDWNRPSLYDQINSSLGWNESNNNYADPARRDAALNRKLTDAEILAFQSGNLTPALQSLVTKYRG